MSLFPDPGVYRMNVWFVLKWEKPRLGHPILYTSLITVTKCFTSYDPGLEKSTAPTDLITTDAHTVQIRSRPVSHKLSSWPSTTSWIRIECVKVAIQASNHNIATRWSRIVSFTFRLSNPHGERGPYICSKRRWVDPTVATSKVSLLQIEPRPFSSDPVTLLTHSKLLLKW